MGNVLHKNDFDSLFAAVKKQAAAAGIPFAKNIDPHIIINTRAKSRFGLCKRTPDGYIIELSAILLDAPELSCMQTLAHELIHTCKGCGDHGTLFKKYASVMNRLYGYDIKRTNSAEEMGVSIERREKTVNYIVECQKCGAQIKRSKYTSVIACPSRYTCLCGGRLKRIK